nr:MAG TPA: YgbF [Caudoviricetes sp.]
MPRKKVDENHKITEPDFVEESAESSTEDTAVYAEDMSPMAEEKVSQEKSDVVGNPDSKAVLRLAKGATFTRGGKVYNKGVLEPVPPDIADKLMKTGFFERA